MTQQRNGLSPGNREGDKLWAARSNRNLAMNSEIPRENEEQHEGQWLVWDMNAQQLAGAAPDLEDLDAEVRAVQDAGHEVYLHFVLPRGTVLAGGLF